MYVFSQVGSMLEFTTAIYSTTWSGVGPELHFWGVWSAPRSRLFVGRMDTKKWLKCFSSLLYMYFNHTTKVFYKHLQYYNSTLNY